MDSCDLVHSIKAEKANVLARYKLFTNIAKAIQLMEAFVVIALISWSSTRLPSAFRFSGEYLFAFASYLMNQHVVFLLGNVIVLVCYVLSRFTDSGNDSGVSGILYDDQLTHRTTVADPPNPNLFPLQVTETQTESRIIETVTKPEAEEAVNAIKQAAKQIERFRRTQSDLKSKISVKPHPELRRSVTERRIMRMASGELESTSTMKSIQAVDKLSNEEFRTAIETFISKQQRFLKQQSMV